MAAKPSTRGRRNNLTGGAEGWERTKTTRQGGSSDKGDLLRMKSMVIAKDEEKGDYNHKRMKAETKEEGFGSHSHYTTNHHFSQVISQI